MRFVYNGTQELIFGQIQLTDGSTLHAVPGQTYDLLEDPHDPRFVGEGLTPPPVTNPLSGETIQHEAASPDASETKPVEAPEGATVESTEPPTP